MTEPAGRIVVLNGSSSAGKSTLALALQAHWESAGEPWVIFSWDDFVPRLPDRWRGVPTGVGDRAAEGCTYRVLRTDPHTEARLVVGDVGRRLLAGYHRSVAALARAGTNVIVEEVMITAEEWADWAEALRDVDVCWVGVHCDADVVERREAERGDRYVGLARGTAEIVHQFATYDLEVDAASATPNELALRIARWMAGGCRSVL